MAAERATQGERMKAYVFLMCRPCDKGVAWPVVYPDCALAEAAFGRASDVVEVELEVRALDPAQQFNSASAG